MAGEKMSRGRMHAWPQRLGAALLLLLVGMSGGACSSEESPPAPMGSGDIPPPLNQPCSSDTDCASFGLKCDPLRGCLPCVFDWHCGKGERCTDDGCKVPAKCSGDSDCNADPKTPHCDPVLSECVGCRVESDCPEKSHCVERSCTAYTPCVNSRDCSEGTVCDRDAGECVECLGSGDCEKDKEVCVAKHCVPVCTSDKDCLSRNQLCHHEKGYCADCVEQEDCPSVYYCSQDLCKLDVCKAGSSQCLGNSLYSVCDVNGSGYEPKNCPTSTSCRQQDDLAECRPWICTPETSDCDAAGQRVRQCAADGLSYSSETDCTATDEVCYLAQCRAKVCEPGTSFCQGSEIRVCSANGTDSVLQATCDSSQFCDDASVTCLKRECVTGAPMCDGDVATKCDALGSGPEPDGTDCAESDQACYDGECRDVLCNGAFCDGDKAYGCTDAGTRAVLVDTCTSNEYCLDGLCRTDKCSAGQAVCDLEVATTCKDDGSGFEPGGTDCAADGKLCENGACVPKLCEPSKYYCSGGNPFLCNNHGTGSSGQYDTCSPSEYCKPGTGYCLIDVCTAGAKVCSGTVATTCAADGSGPAAGGTDCALDNKVCYQGTCLPKICEPNAYFCQGGNSYLCGSTGATSSLSDTCLPSEFCQAGSYYCPADVCTAGAATCNGDNLTTCAADGSGPADAGKSCGAGKTCVAGACKAVICTPDALQCSGGNIQRCTDKGTLWSAYLTCDTSSYCNELATPIACSPDVCAPAANACNGEKLAVCAADGGHFSSTTTNCAASNKVCTLAATCVAVAEDTVGDTTTTFVSSNSMIGNVYRIDRARTLTKLEQYLSVSGTSVFTWVVYEGTSASYGTFSKVYEGTISASVAGAFLSSGTLNVPLKAGKYYYLGVIVQGSFNRYMSSDAAQSFVSFGQLMNSQTSAVSTAPASFSVSYSDYRYNQRVSTAPPPP